MLGKLIKYDMKAINRFLIIIHAFLLLSAVLVRLFLTSHITIDNIQDGTLLGLSCIIYFLIISGVSFGTLMIIAIRFYKNLFSDEGYLTRTLPVTSGQHLLSKTITGSIWGFIDHLLIFISLFIVVIVPATVTAFQENKSELLQAFGINSSTSDVTLYRLIGIMILTCCLGAIASVVLIFASVALGQLFSGHRVLGAVVAYFSLTTVISVSTFAVMTACGYTTSAITAIDMSAPADLNLVGYMTRILGLSDILSLIATVILYIVTYYIMKKKVNLI